MLRIALICCIAGVALAGPSVARSRAEIEAFTKFLESTKTDDGAQFLARIRASPLANAEENSGKYQGDIVLDDFMIEGMIKDFAAGRNAYIFPNTRWPNNTVIWEFGEGEFEPRHEEAIIEGMKDIEKHTCVRFRRREPEDFSYVHLTGKSDGCYAHVGYWARRGPHIYNLAHSVPGVGCFRHATIVHEWLHILGFFHMHSTHDRDNYVKILYENMTPGSESAFNLYTDSQVDNLGVKYDYVSCMQYGPRAFSANGQPTIVALKEHEGVMGQRIFITEKDWLRINRHYGCEGAWD
ncbi:hypothetical protein evm_002067 [Chilo suppressalis]|nr:hypothetical protein evm_002067 [Chilo suppressalis]